MRKILAIRSFTSSWPLRRQRSRCESVSSSPAIDGRVDSRLEHSHHRKCPTNDGHERGQIVIPMSRLCAIRHRNGRQIVDKLGLRHNFLLVQRELTAMKNLVGLELSLLECFQALNVGGDDFEIMMISLMEGSGNIHIAIHGREFGFHVFREDRIASFNDTLNDGFSHGQVVHNVAHIGHVGSQVMMVRSGHDVKVSRNPVQ
mmetsp:Transcript_27896/g.64620  ORF Transcript_27896/g.64620 Transcript_27896/m.64620 type:complete len:202 (+) Transcript_27896:105-710(+)